MKYWIILNIDRGTKKFKIIFLMKNRFNDLVNKYHNEQWSMDKKYL